MGEHTDDKVKELFLEALERDPGERSAWLGDTCPDPALRREVLGLLRAHERAEGFLEQPARPDGGMLEGPGGVIGRYKILQQIGEGGFGVVYMAEQTEPVQRKVALKILKLGMDTEQVVARFEAERQALALMDHPNIAKVLDGGATPKGRPYFVMELVKGVPITEYCDQAGLTTAERLMLFQQVCHAVQHAHQKGIIHRDIKPRNVLVTLHDGRPVPKVIDFGIAKAIDRRLTEKTLFTEFKQIIGTPEYMAPEQAEMTSLDVDTRADIYSLGVLLYELLTGTKPFDMKSLLAEGYGEILRTIREVEPPKPSTRISTLGDQLPAIARQRHTEPRLLGKLIRGDLDWISMKALEKDRTRRYGTATALSDDIGRYLVDEPVLASPPSRVYRARKYLRRHRVEAIAGGCVLGALVLGLALALWGWSDAAHQAALATAARTEAQVQRDEARDEADKAGQILSVLDDMLASASPYAEPDPDYTVRRLLLDSEQGLAKRLSGRPRVEAAIRLTMARALEDLERLEDADRNLDRARELLGADPGGSGLQLAEVHAVTGLVRLRQGRHQEANEELLRAVAIHRLAPDPDRAAWASALTALGLTQEALGRYGEATSTHREAEAMARVLSEDPKHVLPIVLNNLGMALQDQMHYEEAERMLREALQRFQGIYGEIHPWCTICLNNLSRIRADRGDHDEAYELAKEVLRQRQLQFPADHPLVATALGNLALIETGRKRFAEAREMLDRAYAINHAHYGDEHPRTATTLNSLGVLLGEQEQYADAEAHFRKSLEIRRRALGEGHRRTCLTLMNLGGCIARQEGRFEEARATLLDAAARMRRAVGDVHRDVGQVLEELVRLYRTAGLFEDAEHHAREVLALRERALGPEHPEVAQALIDLGHLRQALGRFDESVTALERARDIAVRRRGKDHPNVAVALEHLSTALRQTSEPGRALPALAEAHGILVGAYGKDDRRSLRVALELALLRSDLGDSLSGETLIREVLASKGQPPPMRPSALTVLGQCLLRQSRFDEAKAPLEESLALRTKRTPGSWLRWNTASLLGECLVGQERFEEAERVLLEAQAKMQPPDSAMGHRRSREALARLVHLYETWGKPGKAAEWQARLEAAAD